MKFFIALLFSFCSIVLVQAQEKKEIVTETYRVEGNCEHCKKRIEDASYIRGVKHAEWNKDTKQLTVVYKTTKTNADAILKSIANSGHDNEKYKADDKVYEKLPECCLYRLKDKH
jgi:copper chaperone CopZ